MIDIKANIWLQIFVRVPTCIISCTYIGVDYDGLIIKVSSAAKVSLVPIALVYIHSNKKIISEFSKANYLLIKYFITIDE